MSLGEEVAAIGKAKMHTSQELLQQGGIIFATTRGERHYLLWNTLMRKYDGYLTDS